MNLANIPDHIGTFAFRQAHAFVLGQEGEGCWQGAGEEFETCWGLARKYNQEIDPWPPSKDEAIEHAYEKYWRGSLAEELRPALGIMHYDHSFNAGVWSGQQLLTASNGDFERYTALRLEFYAADVRKNLFKINGRGWVRRVADCIQYADNIDPDRSDRIETHLTVNHTGMYRLTLRDAWRIFALSITGRPVQLEGDMIVRIRPMTSRAGWKLDIGRPEV